MECRSCYTVVNGVGDEARRQVLAIPGVQAAIDFHNAMLERGQDIGWNDVQTVQDAADTYRVMNTPMTPEMAEDLNKAFHPSGVEEFSVDQFIRDFQKRLSTAKRPLESQRTSRE